MLKGLFPRCCFVLFTISVAVGSEETSAQSHDTASDDTDLEYRQPSTSDCKKTLNGRPPYLMNHGAAFEPCKPCGPPPCRYPVMYVIVFPCGCKTSGPETCTVCGTCGICTTQIPCKPSKPCEPCKPPCNPAPPCKLPEGKAQVYLVFNKRMDPLSYGQLMDVVTTLLKPCQTC